MLRTTPPIDDETIFYSLMNRKYSFNFNAADFETRVEDMNESSDTMLKRITRSSFFSKKTIDSNSPSTSTATATTGTNTNTTVADRYGVRYIKALVIRESIKDDEILSRRLKVRGPLCTSNHDSFSVDGLRYNTVDSYVECILYLFDNTLNEHLESGRIGPANDDEDIVKLFKNIQPSTPCRNKRLISEELVVDEYLVNRIVGLKQPITGKKGEPGKMRRSARKKTGNNSNDNNAAAGGGGGGGYKLLISQEFIKRQRCNVMEKAYFEAFKAKWLIEKNQFASSIAIAISDSEDNPFDDIVHVRPEYIPLVKKKDNYKYCSSIFSNELPMRRLPIVELVNTIYTVSLFINENALGRALMRLKTYIKLESSCRIRDEFRLLEKMNESKRKQAQNTTQTQPFYALNNIEKIAMGAYNYISKILGNDDDAKKTKTPQTDTTTTTPSPGTSGVQGQQQKQQQQQQQQHQRQQRQPNKRKNDKRGSSSSGIINSPKKVRLYLTESDNSISDDDDGNSSSNIK